jgi:uncharacterized protein (DUF1330 family)
MPAYVIADVYEVRDQDALVEYRRRNTDAVANHGGRFVIRGGEVATLEGAWEPLRMVVIEFPDVAAARAWWDSEEYAPLKRMRQDASDTNIVLVEGA